MRKTSKLNKKRVNQKRKLRTHVLTKTKKEELITLKIYFIYLDKPLSINFSWVSLI